jgi:lipopolysaccharide transport system ATP-binding protein
MRPIVRVEHLAKRYTVGTSDAAYETLRDTIAAAFKSKFSRAAQSRRAESSTLWALQDVSFEVRPGEVMGIIGHNGAGKSTLLKILSRVTRPTKGRIELYGRLGSLLEVGTGFHPELTGRENIFLSGTILGMPRDEIKRRFDEIVAFSEVERFIDTPVKRYSSGMYVRLAFSVAAHLEPDILLVDEVLAVGDQAFQRKCLERVKQLRASGATILLVSHSMASIQSTSERALLLQHGSIMGLGPTAEIVKQYRDSLRNPEGASNDPQNVADSPVKILAFEMLGRDGQARRNFMLGEEISIRIKLRAETRIESPLINFGVRRGDGVIACNFNNWYDNFKIDYIEGDCVLEGWLPPLRLIPYFYEAHVWVWQRCRGYSEDDLSALRPLCAVTFGEFSIDGPPLSDQDGVFQEPSRKWVLIRGNERFESRSITDNSLYDAYGLQGNTTLYSN